MAGKSSIIDILVFSLWGKLLRGTQKSMIRKGTTECNLCVVFESNGKLYQVDRKDTLGRHYQVTFTCGTTNLTGVSVDATYKNIRDHVGSLEQFKLINLYNDAEYDVIRVKDSERAARFMEIFGMPEYATAIHVAKQSMSKLNASINALVVPRNVAPVVGLESLKEQRRELAQEVRELDKVPRPAITRPESVIRAELVKCLILDKPQEVPMAMPAPAITLSIQEVTSYRALLAGPVPSRSSATINALLAEVTIPLGSPPEDIKAKLTALQSRRSALTPPSSPAILPEYSAELSVEVSWGIPKEYKDKLSFGDTCPHCVANAAACSNEESKMEVLQRRKELEQRHRANVAANARAQSVYAASVAAYETSRATLDREIMVLENELSTAVALAETIRVSKQKQDTLRAELALATRYETARARMDALQKYKDYKAYVTYQEALGRVTAAGERNSALAAELEAALRNKPIAVTWEAARVRLASLNTQISAIDIQIGALSAQETTYRAECLIRETYEREHPALTNRLTCLKLYVQALQSSQLRNNIITTGMAILLETTNQLCKQFGFTIRMELGQDMHFLICHNGHELPIVMASGMQKFAISLALRIAICNHLPVPLFMFIDEGFGAVGLENMEKMKEILVDCASGIDYLFCISHMQTLQNILVAPLHINCIDDTTTVTNTVLVVPTLAEGTCSCGKQVKKANMKHHVTTQYHIKHSKK
jgi:DNA repair exonuclease SbcCD ATPase subunit